MKKFLIITLLTIGFSFSSFAQSDDDNLIIIRGSDTMFELTKTLSEEFMDLYPEIEIRVYGGGTSTGIKDLLDNKIDICTASRDLTATESKELAEYYNSIGMYYLVAKDAICIYLNKKNKKRNFTKDELFKIFTGQVKSWNSFNGTHESIIPVIRPITSGTRRFFSGSILNGEEFTSDAVVIETTNGIAEFVNDNPNAIGFGGLGYDEDINLASVDGISPIPKNICNDKYPLTRYLHFFTSRKSKGTVKKFIDYVLSPEGQKIINDLGFVPLWEINY